VNNPLIPDAAKPDQAKADEANPHPQATPPAHPEVEVQTSAPAEVPPSLPNTTSHRDGEKGGPTNPSLDTVRLDSLGNAKTADVNRDPEDPEGKTVPEPVDGSEEIGPRGHGMPADVMTEAERQAKADAAEKKMQAGLAPTNTIDSRGDAKGAFKVIPQGNDKHGMRLPDKVTSQIVEPVAAQVGPRGAGAPLDSFHGARPEKKQ
jgi:hypothetical protein